MAAPAPHICPAIAPSHSTIKGPKRATPSRTKDEPREMTLSRTRSTTNSRENLPSSSSSLMANANENLVWFVLSSLVIPNNEILSKLILGFGHSSSSSYAKRRNLVARGRGEKKKKNKRREKEGQRER